MAISDLFSAKEDFAPARSSIKLGSRALTAVFAFVFLLAIPYSGSAQTPLLNQHVLIVYNSGNPDSVGVANYYASKRSIPAANLCAISPSSTTSIGWSAFESTVRTPIRNCLNLIGPNNILYIVFAYQTPYEVIAPDQAMYAVDQFIADVWDAYTPSGQYGLPPSAQPYFTDAQTQGNFYVPFVSLADYRSGQNSLLIYSVWRLDAATPDLAKGLVDKALLAESTGLSGQVCIDEKNKPAAYDYGPASGDWDLHQAATFSREAGFSVTEDSNPAEFGTAPAPLRCDNAALYSGWYKLNHYNDAFSWNTGAIGFHLDSASALNPRGGPNWSANALIRGIAVTSGCVSEPYLEGLLRPDGVFRNLFEGANVGDAFLRNTTWLKWVILNMGDPLYRPFPASFPAVTGPQNSLAFVPQYLVGGHSSSATITLAAPAPSGGVTVALKSNQTALATVPPSVTVASGLTAASFPISTKLVRTDSPVLISAIFGTSMLTNTLVLQPLLAGIALSPSSVTGGSSVTGTVVLNDNAPAGGVEVIVSANNAAVSVPASVLVPAGTSRANFDINTLPVSANQSVSISGSYAGATPAATLILQSPIIASLILNPTRVKGGGSTTGTVTLTGPAPSGGTSVKLSTSNPTVTTLQADAVVVPEKTMTASFSIMTNTVAANTTVNIVGVTGSTSRTARLTVTP